jgi:uncharacterized protein YdaU (DUF1376 family)
MAELSWFPVDCDEWTQRTRGMSAEAVGALFLLVLYSWRDPEPCTVEHTPDALSRALGARWRKLLPLVADHFPLIDGRLRCAWLAELHTAQSAKHAKRVVAGSEGGKAKAKRQQTAQQNPSNATSNASGNAGSMARLIENREDGLEDKPQAPSRTAPPAARVRDVALEALAYPAWFAFVGDDAPSRDLAVQVFAGSLPEGEWLGCVAHSNAALQGGLSAEGLEGAMHEWAGKCARPEAEDGIRHPSARLWVEFLRSAFRGERQHQRRLAVSPPQRAASSPVAMPDEAESLCRQIMGFKVETPIAGGGMHRAIPKVKVAALGDDVLEAYTRTGGATRFLNDPPDKHVWLYRDFGKHLAAVRAGEAHVREDAQRRRPRGGSEHDIATAGDALTLPRTA